MDFTEKLRLKGKAEEDMYFARLDRQLIDVLHEKREQEDAISHSEYEDGPIITVSSKTLY